MFIRFVVGSEGEDHRELNGILSQAKHLRNTGVMTAEEEARLEARYDWFNAYLPEPPYDDHPSWSWDAVSWFKDDALPFITRMWDIVAILEEHGVPVRMLRSRNPGRVVYEDRYQIVVEEWNQL
jgi:hypothetical protein